MAAATAWVAVDQVDQLAHRVLAIADHLRWVAAGRGHQLVADHQQAEIVAGEIALDDDFVAVLAGRWRSPATGFPGCRC
jgi:hypothetical protein